MGDQKTHPDFGEMEAYRRGEADAAIVEHIRRCAQCQFNLKELEELVDLVREDAALPPIPDEIDKRMLWNAQQNAARVRRQNTRRGVQRWAIAASLLLCAATALLWRQRNPATVAKLDIVDALALARKLAAAQPTDRSYDVNHDGRIDNADVDGIVRQAVALGDA